MPKTFEEAKLRFVFDDSWSVIKYDDHRDYRERISRLDGTKAVDFVAVYANEMLYLIEVKDFEGTGMRIEPASETLNWPSRSVKRFAIRSPG